MRKVLFTLFVIPFSLLSQNRADSLWSVWNDPNINDSSRLSAIHTLGWSVYLFSNPDSANLVARMELELAEKMSYKLAQSMAHNTIAVHYYLKGNYSKGIDHLNICLSLDKSIDNFEGIGNDLSNLGVFHYKNGALEQALKNYVEALDLFEKTDAAPNKTAVCNTLGNIGLVYYDQKEFEKALEYHFKSKSISEELNDLKSLANTFTNIGAVYMETGLLDKAYGYFIESLMLSKKVGDSEGQATATYNIGEYYFEKGVLDSAIIYTTEALYIARRIGSKNRIKEASILLYKCHKTNGNHKDAIEMYELYIATRDSLESEENQKAVIRQEYKYQYEKQAAADSIKAAEANKVKDALIEAEQAKNERNELKLEQGEIEKKQQEQQSYFLFGGLALALLFGGFIFNRFRVTKKQRDIIDEQKSVVESQKSLVEEQKQKVDQAYEQLEEKNTEILDSINYAKRIQSAILPPKKLVKEYLNNSFILYKPKDIVAGDFYWMEPVENGVLFAAADCTGHGVPGAMVSVVCNNGLNRSVREHGLMDPGQILDKTRKIVISEFEKSEEEMKDGMDIALCSLQGKTLRYAGAHNPLWIIRKGATEVEEIKANKQPIGKYDAPQPYTTHTVELNDGDSFYIFSDGYADQFGGERGKKYKTANFKRLLLSIQNESIERQRQLIDDAFESWKGQLEQLDDVCVIGVKL